MTDPEIEAAVRERFHVDRVESVDGRVTIELTTSTPGIPGGEVVERHLEAWLDGYELIDNGTGCDTCGHGSSYTITGIVRPGVELPPGSAWGWK